MSSSASTKLGVYLATGLDDSLVCTKHPLMTGLDDSQVSIICQRQLGVYPITGLDDSLVWDKRPPLPTTWCVLNNRPRRRSLVDNATECQCVWAC